jgi:hypothetical protein
LNGRTQRSMARAAVKTRHRSGKALRSSCVPQFKLHSTSWRRRNPAGAAASKVCQQSRRRFRLAVVVRIRPATLSVSQVGRTVPSVQLADHAQVYGAASRRRVLPPLHWPLVARVCCRWLLEHGRYRRFDGSHAPQRLEAYVASAEDVRSRWSHHRGCARTCA